VTLKHVLVISDSLQSLPKAVEALAACGHGITYIPDLTPLPKIRGVDLGSVDAVVMGPVIGAELGITYVTLDQVMAQSDVVNVFASLNSATRHMVGRAQIALMQSHAFLVNIARGELVDEAALTEALVQGRIAGAALDVFEVEPLTDSPLFALDNVILTPHQAGLTHRAKSDAAVTAVRNALAVLAGAVPPNLVNQPARSKP